MNPNQPNYAKSADNFANEPPLQLTLRVMHELYSNPRFWIGMAVIVMVLTIMGPFGTLADLTFAPRLVYWGAISLLSFPVGMAASIFFGVWLSLLGVPEALSRLLGGAIGGIPIGLIVFIANGWFALTIDNTFDDLVRMIAYAIPISAAVSLIYYLVDSSIHPETTEATANLPQQNGLTLSRSDIAFLKRLPVELGKDIISLQAQDHYVRVNTTKGSEMVLIRLSDAESELEGIEGTRVHRSWWLARAHVSELKRDNDKLFAVLSNGEKVPVSRTYAKQVRSWFHL